MKENNLLLMGAKPYLMVLKLVGHNFKPQSTIRSELQPEYSPDQLT